MDDREEKSRLDELAPTDFSDLATNDEPLILEEVKIEEVGIDGMCGVY